MQFEDLVRKCFDFYVDKDREILKSLLNNDFTFSSSHNPSLAKSVYLEKNVTF